MTVLDRAEEEADEASATLDEREFGFWLYLMSDAVLFALLFATYAVMVRSHAGGAEARELFSLYRAFGETILLLFSSMTFGLASAALAVRSVGTAFIWLAVTFALGAGFLGLELAELSGLITAGAGPDSSGFFSAFFTLVGAHGLHVAMGLVWILILSVQLRIEGPTLPVLSRLRRLGLFWHFLDIVWIGIYSVVYLPVMI